ncbi:MAG: hypothetical protein OXI05_06705, partial [Bacteroidota bacterium]|nr:hypothetical protein [Bacteroidota bacterium]
YDFFVYKVITEFAFRIMSQDHFLKLSVSRIALPYTYRAGQGTDQTAVDAFSARIQRLWSKFNLDKPTHQDTVLNS